MGALDEIVVNRGASPSPRLDEVLTEAKKRWKWCAEWEAQFRPRFINDVKFANGDSDNGYQWPNDIYRERGLDSRPCLTMNLIRQHNLNISNEARKNKSSVRVVGTGNGATEEAAKVFRDVIRHIEMTSKAQDAYTIARGWQIDGGIGWWRIITDYETPDSFDQSIFIRPVNDPLSIYLDPDIQQKDGSDARFGFVFDSVPKEEFDEAYPDLSVRLQGLNPMGIGSGDNDWVSRDFVRVCEYFRKVKVPDQVISFVGTDQARRTVLASKLPSQVAQQLLTSPTTKSRPTNTEVIEWFLIAGETVVDETLWPGKYIPLVRVIGEEIVIEGQMDRKGHTRTQKDAQRMLNFNASAQVEFVALQGKSPWVAPAAAIEEYETMWNTANIVNHSVLVYNAFDDEGNPLPTPQRAPPPTFSPAYQTGMDTAFNQLMMVSGQWQNQMGMQGNERTGAAINARQAQSATAVFHFQDNYEVGLRFTGTQLIDLIPIIYDTKRVISIIADDGTSYDLEIDPGAKQAFAQKQAYNGEIVRRIFNPNIGKYSVAPTIGPAYDTERAETRDGLAVLLSQAKELTPVIGDLFVASLDFEGAQEAAQRLKRMVPPAALGQGPSQSEQALQAQIQSLTTALSESLQRQGKAELKLVGKDQKRDIEAVQAQTGRLTALKDFLPSDPEGLAKLIKDAIRDALQTDLSPIINANANNLDIDGTSTGAGQDMAGGAANDTMASSGPSSLPMPRGARQASDGQWYIEDPTRDGKYMRVEPK